MSIITNEEIFDFLQMDTEADTQLRFSSSSSVASPMLDDAYIRVTYLLPKHPRTGVGIHNNPCIV